MDGEGGETYVDRQDKAMLTALAVTLIITIALGSALRVGRNGGLISRQPYNNRYNDASGARDDWLG
jgi:hypothetical protein